MVVVMMPMVVVVVKKARSVTGIVLFFGFFLVRPFLKKRMKIDGIPSL